MILVTNLIGRALFRGKCAADQFPEERRIKANMKKKMRKMSFKEGGSVYAGSGSYCDRLRPYRMRRQDLPMIR